MKPRYRIRWAEPYIHEKVGYYFMLVEVINGIESQTIHYFWKDGYVKTNHNSW